MRTLNLRGEELQCSGDGVSIDLLFELAEIGENPTNAMKSIGVMRRALYEVVLPEEHDRLKAILAKMTLKDIDELNLAVGGLLAAETDRPTERSSDSQVGSAPTGGPSRVVSLSRGTVQEASQSSKAGLSAAS